MEMPSINNHPAYVSHPLLWVTAQKVKNDRAHFLTIHLSYTNPPTEGVLSGESDRLVNDDEYFVREAMMTIFQVAKSGNVPIAEYDFSSATTPKKPIGTYEYVLKDGKHYLVFVPSEV
jgi:hypothetical protein